ncbi:MAG: hemerythrin domain-containing protein [Steroidobacteraceae bacterium]
MQHTHTATHRSSTTRPGRSATTGDALTLLKADHAQVKSLFQEFERAHGAQRKLHLAQRICKALKVHTEIEEEIFYPAFLAATQEQGIHHEAEIEHAEAKDLIAKIESSTPDDDYFDAKVHVLSEMIRHHVNEEEKRDGMFAHARRSSLDLKTLGEQMRKRQRELMATDEVLAADIAATIAFI